jgi:hypothetical protein
MTAADFGTGLVDFLAVCEMHSAYLYFLEVVVLDPKENTTLLLLRIYSLLSNGSLV